METLCEYCKTPYIPKRSDSMYCSQSCKQSAYVLRKAGNLTGVTLGHETTDEEETLESEQNLFRIGQEYRSAASEETAIGQENRDEKPEVIGIYQSAESETPLIGQKSLTDNQESAGTYRSTAPEKTGIGQNLLTDTADNSWLNLQTVTDNVRIKANHMTDTDTEREIKQDLGEYREHKSMFLTEITQIIEERDNVEHMALLLYIGDSDIYWVSGRYKCFLECLLVFSEMKTIQADDLKELCNAFTHLVYSPHFHALPNDYPYGNEIIKLREKLKCICLNLEPNGRPFPFILQTSTRQKLLASRWELSNYFPKISFSELDFN